MIELEGNVEVGILILHEGSWRQGYAWTESSGVRFVESPKSLPNDIVWFTNAPYDVCRGLGIYFKPDRFFRTPLSILFNEVMPGGLHPREQAIQGGKMLKRMARVKESPFLRGSPSLSGAISRNYTQQIKDANSGWAPIARQAVSWYWQGFIKNRLLMSGSLYAPRQEMNMRLLSVKIPDFSVEPKHIKESMSHPEIMSMMKEYGGFVSARVESVSRNIQEFISLNRTIWTTNEISWLLSRAKVTIKSMWVAPLIEHPCKKADMVDEIKAYSWLDGLRMEGLYLSPGGRKNVAADVYLRATNHVFMAMHAEYLAENLGVTTLSLSFCKLGVAYSSNERERVSKAARECGLIPALPKDHAALSQWRDDLFDDI